LTIILLFGIFYWDISIVAEVVNSFQTNLTSHTISLLMDNMEGNEIIINPHYSLVIEKACNGVVPYLLLLSSILAFPSTIKNRVIWATLGYITITVLNIFRIWLITKIVEMGVDNFSLAHDFIGNAILILTSLLLFLGFIRSNRW
jgi:exosortase/archaeosortase family protein